MTLPDQAQRDRIAQDLDRNLLVEASAGTGKTTCLVTRVTQLVVQGHATIQEICAITFTRRAGGELRLKVREALEAARGDADALGSERAALALAGLEAAAIGTIHSFAATLLRERPLECHLDPDFRIDQKPAETLRGHFRDWLELCLDRDDPLLRRYFLTHGDEQVLFRTLTTLWDLRDMQVPGVSRAWSRRGASDQLLDPLQELARELDRDLLSTATSRRRLEPLLSFGRALAGGEFPRDDLDRCEAELLHLTWRHPAGKSRPRIDETEWGAEVDPADARGLLVRAYRLHRSLEGYRKAARRDLAERLLPRLRRLLRDSGTDFNARANSLEERFRRRGSLDHLGLLLGARDLVRDDLAARRSFQARYRRILVDEIQDTDPLQLEVVALLVADDYEGSDWRAALRQATPGRLFAVGDLKQSIYRFRRADLGLAREFEEHLRSAGGEVLRLTANFRARPGLTRFTNLAFARIFAESAGPQPEYGPITAQRPASKGPSIVSLNLGCSPRVAQIREREPEVVAEYLARTLNLGQGRPLPAEPIWVQPPSEGEPRPAEPRDVVFLFKHFRWQRRDLTEPYVRALAERGIRSLLFSGSSFRRREETLAALAALQAIERPEDRIAVYAALRGPLFGFLDDDLLGDLSPERLNGLDPRRDPDPDLLPAPLVEALALLRRLHRARNYVPVSRTIQELFDRTRLLSSQAALPHARRRLANLLKVQRLARQFDAEAGEAASFRAFVDRLKNLEEEPDSPLAEEGRGGGRGGVRFITMHGCKGLEFPVVYLADPTATSRPSFDPDRIYRRGKNEVVLRVRGAGTQPTQHFVPSYTSKELADEKDQEVGEAERLLYVATTRARDALILPRVPGWVDERYDRLSQRLVPTLETLQEAGDETLRIVVPPATATPEELPAASGPAADPAALYRAWRAESVVLRERASRPTRPSIAVTSLAHAPGDAVPIDFEPERWHDHDQDHPPAVVFGAPDVLQTFGTFVHLVLSYVPLDADAAAVTGYTRLLAASEAPGLSQEHLALAEDHARWTLAHPLLERARLAQAVHRELPLAGRLAADPVLVEGIADLVFRELGGLVVVDYKTGPQEPKHRDQLSLYAQLLGEDQVAECWALYTGERVAVRTR